MRRSWLAAGAAAAATLLAAADGRTGWTVFVALATGGLAAAVVAAERGETRGEREERERARHQAEVDAILWRYERERAARGRAASGGDGDAGDGG